MQRTSTTYAPGAGASYATGKVAVKLTDEELYTLESSLSEIISSGIELNRDNS
jgi:hypothetical protein